MKKKFVLCLFSIFFCFAGVRADEALMDNVHKYAVTIHSAQRLYDTDLIGKRNNTDPYVVVYALLRTPGNYVLHEVGRTHILNDTLNPKWEQTIEFTVHKDKYLKDVFVARVVDKADKLKGDTDLGFVEMYCKGDERKQNAPLSAFLSAVVNEPRNGFRKGIKRGVGSLTFTVKKYPVAFALKKYAGEKLDTALKEPQLSLLDVKIKNVYISKPAQDGKIIGQTPKSGTGVKEGDRLVLGVAKLQKVVVPDFTKLKYSQALSRLQSLGLDKGYKKEKETGNPRQHGYVAEQSKLKGSTVALPCVVNFVVYKYVEPDPVDFPDIVGSSYREAAKRLADAGLKVNRVTKEPYDAQAGQVIRTMPDRDSRPQLMPGTGVTLVLAAPDKLGLTLAFPIEKSPGEVVTLDFNKHETYYFKLKPDQKGYIRFTAPDGDEGLPLAGDVFNKDSGVIDKYSSWYDRRAFKVTTQEYFVEFKWDVMTRKDENNATVKLKYEFIPEMDAFEPDDTIYDAAFISTGVINKIAVYPGNDVDWFCYEADADGYIRLNLGDVPDAIRHDFIFEVYEEGSKENLHFHENLPVSFNVHKGKKYFIKISVLGVDRSTSTFDMTIDLILEKDQTEPNDSITEAYEIKGGYQGEFYFMGKAEADFFKVFPPEGATVMNIDVDHPRFKMTPRVYWGGNKQEIEKSDFCRPKEKTCSIPLSSSEPIYLYMRNEYELQYSDKPFTLRISYPTDRLKSIDLAKQAYQLLLEKQYDQSIELYERAIDLFKDPRYWHDMGIAYFRQKKWDDAKRSFEKSLVLEDKYYLGYKSLGSVLGELKDYKGSIEMLKKALEISSDDPMIYYDLARSYEGISIEEPENTEALKTAFEYSSKAYEYLADVQKVKVQYKRLGSKLK